ncbi:deleted in azoospermia-like isoform X3 [Brachyhypopomus gauderio]|uniref:deleted in azoospermia-like isoform X3 n=1 Tax=Brachyhypopomus gauderio TaxID=698409 RepID=UPI004041FECB
MLIYSVVLVVLNMDMQKQRCGFQSSALKLSNGYILPEGKTTPNTLFVGGIDMKVPEAVEENEIRDFFARYGTVKEVKIITYRGGICKGYGFVYFTEDVDIQTIVEITFKGKKLKLGPAIMKERSSRSVQSPLIGPSQWVSPSPYLYCTCCPTGMAPSSPVLNGGSPYLQPYSFSSFPGVMVPQVPVNYTQTAYSYPYPLPQWCGDQRSRIVNQNYVDCGVQTLLTLL